MNKFKMPSLPVLMLIDDDHKEQAEIGKFLSGIGYQVEHFDDGLLTVQKARQLHPDMILIKAEMAKTDGFCLCTELKSHSSTQDIPVMMYSKEYNEELVKQAFDVGAIDFLTGPTLQWTMLYNRIRQVLKLQQTEFELNFLSKVFDTTNDGVIITDTNSIILKVNRGFCHVTGYSDKEVIGQTPKILHSGRHDNDFYKAMWDSINATGQWEGEVWNKRKSGNLYAEWLNISAIVDGKGSITNYVGIFSDITSIENRHEQMSHLAYHDYLTGLPNRLLFEERLGQAIFSAERTEDKFSVMYIDIDRFKPVNDQLGHDAGDALLKAITERLSDCVRQSDTLARIGGDEFMILLSHLHDNQSPSLVADKILGLLSKPFSIKDTDVTIGCSIGISIYPADGNRVQELIQCADMAMYQAKLENQSAYQFFTK